MNDEREGCPLTPDELSPEQVARYRVHTRHNGAQWVVQGRSWGWQTPTAERRPRGRVVQLLGPKETGGDVLDPYARAWAATHQGWRPPHPEKPLVHGRPHYQDTCGLIPNEFDGYQWGDADGRLEQIHAALIEYSEDPDPARFNRCTEPQEKHPPPPSLAERRWLAKKRRS